MVWTPGGSNSWWFQHPMVLTPSKYVHCFLWYDWLSNLFFRWSFAEWNSSFYLSRTVFVNENFRDRTQLSVDILKGCWFCWWSNLMNRRPRYDQAASISLKQAIYCRFCVELCMKDKQRGRTFEGQEEENCRQDQQHAEGEWEDGNIDLEGEWG